MCMVLGWGNWEGVGRHPILARRSYMIYIRVATTGDHAVLAGCEAGQCCCGCQRRNLVLVLDEVMIKPRWQSHPSVRRGLMVPRMCIHALCAPRFQAGSYSNRATNACKQRMYRDRIHACAFDPQPLQCAHCCSHP